MNIYLCLPGLNMGMEVFNIRCFMKINFMCTYLSIIATLILHSVKYYFQLPVLSTFFLITTHYLQCTLCFRLNMCTVVHINLQSNVRLGSEFHCRVLKWHVRESSPSLPLCAWHLPQTPDLHSLPSLHVYHYITVKLRTSLRAMNILYWDANW